MTLGHWLIEVDIVFAEDTVAEQFEATFDELADAMAELGDGIDGDVSANGRTRTITLHMTLADEDDDVAITRGMAAARTVIHAAGGPTPGWEKITLHPTGEELTSV